MKTTQRMIFISLLVSMALAISLIESMIPLPVTIPGAKLGLSNIVILITLMHFGFKEAIVVSALKSFLLMLITGSVTSFAYSLAGSLLSSVVMSIAYRFFSRIFSSIGISILGAVAHTVGQLIVASYVLGNIMVFTYLPILTLIGLFTGYFVGLSAGLVSKQLNRVIQIK